MRRREISWRALCGFAVLAALVPIAVGVASAQPPTVQYAYDELGRLVAVVDPDGNAAIYVYDAVGNLLSIQRVDAATRPERVAITALVPSKGKPGTTVSVLGKGFGINAGDNVVAFNGVAATVAYVSANRLITTVPPGATTGPLTVTAPQGSAIAPGPFRIVGEIDVTPATASLQAGGTQQFVAIDAGVETTHVIWAADAIVGGDPNVGTISPQGLYTAPLTIASLRTVTVTATSRDDVTGAAMATVTLHPPVPTFLAASPVGVGITDQGPRLIVAAGVGVQRAPDSAGFVLAEPIGVSPPRPGAFVSASVSVSVEPLITSVSPAAAARGSTNLTLTLTGSGLAGAIGLELLLNQVADPAITVTNLTAATDGKEVTVQLSITATAVLGPRVVRIHAAFGPTTAVGTGNNVFTVQ
ncbi:MAG: IPT/TIG domain-containing protein [Gammaproteobacteria bacterium]